MDNTENTKKKKGKLREYAEALLTAAIIAFFIRAFVLEAFKIPSGSMIPTLSVGDHIFVNKFIYGLRIPFTKYRFFEFKTPERGDVLVFIYPIEEDKDFIKRVIGLPGDKITIDGTNITINGRTLSHNLLTIKESSSNKKALITSSSDPKEIPYVPNYTNFDFFEEEIGKIKHIAQYEKDLPRSLINITVPQGKLFVMGDNRDNSLDSREWGFVPHENIKGKAMFVWLSLDKDQGGIRWKEFGRWIR